MATTQHYLWASGHFILLISAFRCLMATASWRDPPTFWYQVSFTGALISYAIVCQKAFGLPQLSSAYVRRALLDENVQYFLLALFWWSSRPIGIALLPYTIFSLFHALTFARTTLMPQFFPPRPPASDGGPPQPHPMAKGLQVWVKANYDRAMRAVAYIELLIFVRVLFGTLTLQNSLLSPIIYAHFLRQRYYQSVFTRDAVAVVTRGVDMFVNAPGRPPVVVMIWEKTKMFVGRWAGTVLEPGQTGTPRR